MGQLSAQIAIRTLLSENTFAYDAFGSYGLADTYSTFFPKGAQQQQQQQQQQQPPPPPPPSVAPEATAAPETVAPRAAVVTGPTCTDNDGNTGTCIDVSQCTGTPKRGFCAGKSNIQCCITGAATPAPPDTPPPVTPGDGSYDPNVPVPTGSGFSSSFSGLQTAHHDAGGPVYFKSKAAVDTDGSGPLHGDPDAQSQTSLRLTGSRSLNADITPYFVLPPSGEMFFCA
jgi:hypothetical protein